MKLLRERARALRRDAALPVVLVVAAALIFANMGDRYLWDDEAETALLARNVLRFGVPMAWDGRDLISQECGSDYSDNYLWRQTPWLPVYVTAASFALLGEGTWTARLPFALVGLATVASLYLLAVRVFADRGLGYLAVVAMVLTVPFLLHVRQARYYALAIFGAVWLLYFFFRALADARGSPVGLAAAFTVLFHSSYLGAAAMTAGLVAGLPVLRPGRAALGRLAVASVIALAFNAPWFVLLDLGGKAGIGWSSVTPDTVVTRVLGLVQTAELYALPSVTLGVALGIWCLWSRPALAAPPGLRPALALGVLVAVHIVVVALMPWQFFRYLVTLLPAWALLLAWVVRTLARRSRVVAALVLVLTLIPDRADLVRGTAGSPIVKYLDEITHDFDGPIEVLVGFLRTEASAGQRLFISYGDLPLRFYTTLEVRGGQGCQRPVLTPPPDWIVVRYFFRFGNPAPGSAEDAERVLRQLREDIPWQRYRPLQLASVDTVWENIPEPDRHLYRSPPTGHPVTIYRKAPPPQGDGGGR